MSFRFQDAPDSRSRMVPNTLIYAFASGAAAATLISFLTPKTTVSASGIWTLTDIERQYQSAKARGWLPFFEQAAANFGFRPEHLMGIASRETNIENIKGDYVNGVAQGYGIMQIDIKSYPDFIRSGEWSDPRKNIWKGAEVLKDKRQFIIDNKGVKRTVGKLPNRLVYVGVSLTQLGLLRTSMAAYNCGEWAYGNISTYGNPDLSTARHDYSTDVMNRVEVLDRLRHP